MKELRYILAVLFSSLIIISGVGVSIIHYCCAGCEAAQSCCSTGCSKCQMAQHSSKSACKDTGCTAVHYKVDMVKYAHDSSSPLLPLMLFCEQLPLPGYTLPQWVRTPEMNLGAPPYPVNSRHYLALYSMLLI